MHGIQYTVITIAMLLTATVSLQSTDNDAIVHGTTQTYTHVDAKSTGHPDIVTDSSAIDNNNFTTNGPVSSITATKDVNNTGNIGPTNVKSTQLTSRTANTRKPNTQQPSSLTTTLNTATTTAETTASSPSSKISIVDISKTTSTVSSSSTIKQTVAYLNDSTTVSVPKNSSIRANHTDIAPGSIFPSTPSTTEGHVTMETGVTAQGLVLGWDNTTDNRVAGESRENGTSTGRLLYVYDEFEAGDKLWPVAMALTIGVPAIIVLAVTITVLYKRQVAKPRSRMSFYGQNYGQM